MGGQRALAGSSSALVALLRASSRRCIIMLVKGNESPFVRRHAVESLNFQISMLLYGIVSSILIFVLIGIFMLIRPGAVCGSSSRSWPASRRRNGEEYRYPLTIRFVS